MSARQDNDPEKNDPEKKPRRNADDDAARIIAKINSYLEQQGVPNDDPVVPLVVGMMEVLNTVVRTSNQFADQVEAQVTGLESLAKAERDRLKAAISASEAQCRKVEATVGSIDIRTHDLMTRVIEGMASEVADKLRERMVIVEHRHNRMVLWRTGALIAVVLLSTLGGGYIWRAYDDGRATDLLERCLTNPVQDRHTGQLYCQLEAPSPQQ